MADLSQVADAIVQLAAAVLYPSGIGSPSVAGVGVRIYQGWPNPEQLDADLRAATPVCHVSVYPRPEERNTTRYPTAWQPATLNTATLTLAIAGQAVTVGGTIPASNNPHVLTVVANGKPYPYAMLAGDTLASIAAALAALIVVDIPGTVAAGPVVTLPNSARLLAARVGVTGTAIREVRRQERGFQVSVWADTPTHRDAIASALDASFALQTFLAMPDGTGARMVYKMSRQSDTLQKDRLYQRDLFYTIEYATTQSETETQIVQTQLNDQAAVAGVLPFATVSTSFN